jgi:Zn-dependent protease
MQKFLVNGINKMWFLEQGISLEVAIIKVLAILTIVFGVLPLREYFRSRMTFKLGDPTAKFAGKMCLNPLVHFDMLGALCLLIFDFGWAKPIPINVSNFKNLRKSVILTALTGLMVNLSVAMICGFLLNTMIIFEATSNFLIIYWLKEFFLFLLMINITLGILNLLPLPGFDGYVILKALIPKRFLNKFSNNRSFIMITLIILGFIGVFSTPALIAIRAICNFIMVITALPIKIFIL